MAQIALRNPQFKSKATTVGTVKSTTLLLEIDGTLRYTINKNKAVGTSITTFEISELCRDYLNIVYDANYTPITIAIKSTLQNRSEINGGGNDVGSSTIINDIGWEAYGTYLDGANPTVALNQWLLNPVKPESSGNDKNQIFVPVGTTGKVAGISNGGVVAIASYSANSVFFAGGQISGGVTVNRIDCSKYGNGRRVLFINKYGVQQDLWFSLKAIDKIARKNENYKSSTINYANNPADYIISNAPVKTFNTQAKKSYTLNSGYYPEGAVEFFEQLLLSEYVWIDIKDVIIPVRVKSSAITLKTSLNDGLINYTIEFEDAFDYINNIR